jgi:hypothetical protein
MLTTRALMMVLAIAAGLATTQGAIAQDSVDDILEKARSQARDYEKLKRVLVEEPDQNVRLAAFDLMVKDGDSMLHAIAVDAGLASADRLLQAAAFKEAIMSLDRLHLTLSLDKTASQDMQEKAKQYLDTKGDALVIVFRKKDARAGTFSGPSLNGEVSGTLLTYKLGYGSGTLELKDDNAISGTVIVHSGSPLQFLASGRIR